MTHNGNPSSARDRLFLSRSAPGMSLAATVFHLSGVLFVVGSVTLFAAGTVVYLSGNDLGLVAAIAAFAGFVTGIGLLAAARASR